MTTGGCIFCGEEGGSFENIEDQSIIGQMRKNRTYMEGRYNAHKFIAYFQNFTNTYLPLETFKENIKTVTNEDIVGINISTRPDCIPDSYLEALVPYSRKYLITIELGLQTANDETLKKLNRGHDLASFIDAVVRIKQAGLRTCAHIILDLPWDTDEDAIRLARILNALQVDEVKIHNLYLIKGTKMAQLYEKGAIKLISKEAYQERVILFLERLNPEIVISRLVGRAPKREVLFANWHNSWWKVRDEIEEIMNQTGRIQGSLYDNNQKIYVKK